VAFKPHKDGEKLSGVCGGLWSAALVIPLPKAEETRVHGRRGDEGPF